MTDWLIDEQFDFDVSASPVGCGSGLLDDSLLNDEDEVFFGPQTHTEKCAATIVKEQEELEVSMQALNPEQQALLLQESALVHLMIKRGTPSHPSPVAVVHPMKRIEGKKEIHNILTKTISADKENILDQKEVLKTKNASKELFDKKVKPKFAALRERPFSQPDISVTKLPVSKLRGKIQSEVSGPLVDQASLYGLSAEQVQKDKKVVRRRSGLLVKQVASSSLQQPRLGIPSLLPSAIPSSRIKTASTTESKLKHVKAGPSSMVLPQSQLRLPSARKILASKGTPSKSKKKVVGTVASVKCQPSSELKQTTSTPSLSKLKQPESVKSSAKLSDHVTPIQRTPSTRKSIAGRQLIRRKDTSKTPSPPVPVSSDYSSHVEPSASVSCNTASCVKPPTSVSSDTSSVEACVPVSSNNLSSMEPPVHENIINRHKILCEKQKHVSPELEKSEFTEVTQNVESDTTDITESKNVDVNNALSEMNLDDIVPHSEQETCLVEICPDSPVLKLSSVKGCGNFLDPFHTGETPPPLIDIDNVLKPELPREVNLIEF